jgi:ornithine carbamoyltransferase
VVYPKSWAPAVVMRERTRILRAGEKEKLKDLEREALATNAKHQHWECNEALMRGTKGGAARYLHCLPADVTDVSCAAGEVSRAVFEKARLDTYREASHKPFIVAALILLTRFADPAALLTRWAGERRPRK